MNTVDTTTDTRVPRTSVRAATLTGLVTGAAGIGLLKAGGVAMPVVPPGAVLLLVAAVLVAALPQRRWPAVTAVLVGLAELGPSVAGVGDLAGGDVLVSVGTVLRVAGAITAVIAGIMLWRSGRPARRRTA